MYNPCAPMKGVPVEIMTEESDAGTKSTVLGPGQGIKNHTVTIIANSDTPDTALTAGTLQLESAPYTDQEGNWNPFGGGAIDLTAITVTGDKGVMELSFSEVILNAFRAQIGDAVTGGTISVIYNGQ